ncbi:LADA_0A04104g1_1 [Lachancea dasiensis]|uniref:Protein HRI1 n=1 Tax=Lachancea dasiensis TaxID=1072105 RepID=A0A1G4IN98_9SACH|nr:LADA_0A04104g1_1 [Lachancea dasiensis]
MASLIRRVTFQVGQNPADERTLTLSSTSAEGYFISLRPFIQPKESELDFPFEWAFAGPASSAKITEKDELVKAIDFNFEFDTNVQLHKENTHRGEIKTVWKQWESGLVEERGQVFPFGAGKQAIDFFELWQPLDSTRAEFVILNEAHAGQKEPTSVVFSVDKGDFKGLVVTVGKWAQGILFKKEEHSLKGVNFIRAVEQKDGQWKTLLKFGSDADKFPLGFTATKGSTIDSGALAWEVVESNA